MRIRFCQHMPLFIMRLTSAVGLRNDQSEFTYFSRVFAFHDEPTWSFEPSEKLSVLRMTDLNCFFLFVQLFEYDAQVSCPIISLIACFEHSKLSSLAADICEYTFGIGSSSGAYFGSLQLRALIAYFQESASIHSFTTPSLVASAAEEDTNGLVQIKISLR